ncbi:MAG TPA: YceI family protein [Arenibacter sp.]|nr:YceI family protein [Arenibacter sp.]
MGNRLLLISFLFTVLIGYSQETYELSEGSLLTISGTSTVHDWVVTANNLKGTMSYADNIKDISLQVPVADIKSERGAAMDKKMHGALKMEEHPEVSFTFQEIDKSDGLSIKGKLTIAGVGKSVDLKSEVSALDNGYRVTGSKEIILQDFGMEPPTAMFGQIVVGDKVTINYNLVFIAE